MLTLTTDVLCTSRSALCCWTQEMTSSAGGDCRYTQYTSKTRQWRICVDQRLLIPVISLFVDTQPRSRQVANGDPNGQTWNYCGITCYVTSRQPCSSVRCPATGADHPLPPVTGGLQLNVTIRGLLCGANLWFGGFPYPVNPPCQKFSIEFP